MKKHLFHLILLVCLISLMLLGDDLLFFRDYFLFFGIFSLIALVISWAALACNIISLDEFDDYD